jgi:hypothetical protein
MIEDDPRAVMEGKLPALPIMREEIEESWLEEAKPRRRKRGHDSSKLAKVNGNGETDLTEAAPTREEPTLTLVSTHEESAKAS